jgi:nucleolar protein 56
MKLKTTWFGCFVYENDKIVKYKLFPKDAVEIAKRLKLIDENQLLDEMKQLVDDKPIPSEFGVSIKPEDYGYSYDLFRESMLEFGKLKLMDIPEHTDIVQSMHTLTSLKESVNLLLEHLRNWYEIYEVNDLQNIDEIFKSHHEPMVELAKCIKKLEQTITYIERYTVSSMERLAPNLSYVATPLIGAKLITKAGSLENLARMSSSKIQVLGAETALFRHLKNKNKIKPPKHGIIYQHPYVYSASLRNRGKVARTLASKISIAAKVDYNHGEFIGDKLKSDLLNRIKFLT